MGHAADPPGRHGRLGRDVAGLGGVAHRRRTDHRPRHQRPDRRHAGHDGRRHGLARASRRAGAGRAATSRSPRWPTPDRPRRWTCRWRAPPTWSSGAAETIDVSVARTYDITLTSDPCVFTLTGSVDAEAWFLTLLLRQDGTGDRTVTWPAEVTWIDGTAPVLATAAGRRGHHHAADRGRRRAVDRRTRPGRRRSTVAALDDLTDVNAATPADGDVLAWDDGASEWVPAPAATAATISALGFVGQILISDTSEHAARVRRPHPERGAGRPRVRRPVRTP